MALLRPETPATPEPAAADGLPGAGDAPGPTKQRRLRAPRLPGSKRRAQRRREGKVDYIFWISVAWIAVVIFCAIFSGFLPIQNTGTPAGAPFQGISPSHLFGTDNIGNDLFSLCIRGARMAMLVAAASVFLGTVIGGLIGLVAGFFHGAVEGALMWLTDVMLAFPALVFALAVVSFAGASVESVVLTIAIAGIPGYARVARALTLTYAEQNFVLNARAMGARPRRIMFREVLPNVLVPLGAFSALGAALAIIADGGLAFIGLAPADAIDWGKMINQGRGELYQAPQAALAPMLVMFLTIVALNFMGERLGTSLDAREGNL